uniref:Methyltransferase n=1 Tax=Trypanosoma congolense (strain IL3000) TaxID=1068625 RepID=G0UMS7_TRYCI|nr:conserved hypothetical protein [Trypanosoma congolense IL3000]
MLQWVVKEVVSPYGSIATMHWAVQEDGSSDEDSDGAHVAKKPRNEPNQTEKEKLRLQRQLEDAEDQLGAVLWNSNSVALSYLQRHVLVSNEKQYHVVELGAGVGCLGIGLAMAGARVVITDLKELLPLMEKNIELNKERIRSRSGGRGSCAALTWRWGPPPRTKPGKNSGEKRRATTVAEECSGSSCGKDLAPCAVASSSSFVELQRLLDHVDLVVLCDALYGNPKSWPQLLYTLSEVLAANPHCEVINFCEQRVNDVEGEFLKLLQQENERPVFHNDTPQHCSDGTMMETLLQMRGPHRWVSATEDVKEGLSDLGMRVRATRIRWVRRTDDAKGGDDFPTLCNSTIIENVGMHEEGSLSKRDGS